MISRVINKICEGYKSIENYKKAISDNTKTWVCHHRLETHFSDGTPRPNNAYISREELIALDMYYNRPSEELIFLTREEHNTLHKHPTNIKTIGSSGKHWTLSEETKKKQSESWKKGHPNASFYSSLSGKKNKGKHWYNNGIIQVTAFECPEGFTSGRLHKPGEWLERDLETGKFMKRRG